MAPRGWSVSVLYWALLPYDQIDELARDKVEKLGWFDAANPSHHLAFDHANHLSAAMRVFAQPDQCEPSRTTTAFDAEQIYLDRIAEDLSVHFGQRDR